MSPEDSHDDRLAQALREAVDVPVPKGLSKRILAKHREGQRKQRWQPDWLAQRAPWATATATAASLLLIIGVALYIPGLVTPGGGLEEQVIAYVEQDWSRLTQPGQVPDQELKGMFEGIGARLDNPMQDVSYCEMAKVGKHACATIVMAGRKGPIAAIFIQDAYVPQRIPIQHAGFRGIIVPAAKGCIAIVGQPDEDLGPAEDRIRNAVSWI